MGCGQDVSMDMLCMALFCTAINDVLINFCEGQSHADLWVRVRGAIRFLDYYPERSPEQRKKDSFDLPKCGFRGDVRRLTYEQLIATQNFFKDPKNKKGLLRTKRELPKILDLKLSPGQRRAAARYCIELFSSLHGKYNWYTVHPPKFGPPKGIEKLLSLSKSKGKTEPAKA